MAHFREDIRRFATVGAFQDYLDGLPDTDIDWVAGVVFHHTAIPTLAQWRGMRSMFGMRNYYRDTKKWPAGPHFYLAFGADNPDDDGIWMLTPPNEQGVHARDRNADTWGVEVVGNYNNAPWSPELRRLVVDVLSRLLLRRNLPSSTGTLMGHYEAIRPDPTDCPGRSIDTHDVRTWVKQHLEAMPVTDATPQPDPNPTIVVGNSDLTENAALLAKPRADLGDIIENWQRLASAADSQYGEYDIAEVILPSYYHQCVVTGLDPLVVIAQMAHETGWLSSFWCARPQRNPAGIGVNGVSSRNRPKHTSGWAYNWQRERWEVGLSFATWTNHGIPAHIGRLLAYALPGPSLWGEQRRYQDIAMRYRMLPLRLHGSAPTLKLLGRAHNPTGQGWASPGRDYGQQIARKARQLRGEQY